MKNIPCILQILSGWMREYPSLVVTLLWRVELHYIHNGDLEASNRIMRFRAKAYECMIEKYKMVDPDGMELFKQELMAACHVFRQMFPPDVIAENEAKEKERADRIKEIYAHDKEANNSMHIENFEMQAYTHIQDYITEQMPGIKSLFNAEFADKKYVSSEKRSILDILEVISYDEEKRALCAERTSSYMNTNNIGYHEESLQFRGVVGYDGKQHLCPFRTSYGLFYRGQSHYFNPCLASIDRNLNDGDVAEEKQKAAAFERLLQDHPLANSFNNGFSQSLPNGDRVKYPYHVDPYALAQHYGVCTNLLDLTSDKIIAAFFACTGYNRKLDKYYAYNKNGQGVFYVYRDGNIFSKDSRITCVGLQPFSRPGMQAGYMLAMNKGEDFNGLCAEAISFTHDKTIARLVFKLTNFLCEPFTNDVISSKAKKIVKGDSTAINFTVEENALLQKEAEDVKQQLDTMVVNKVVSVFQLSNE